MVADASFGRYAVDKPATGRSRFAAFNTHRSAINYPYPAAVDDVSTATDWLRENAQRYDIDVDRIGGWGYSAGGHLILRAGHDPSVGLNGLTGVVRPPSSATGRNHRSLPVYCATYREAPEVWEDASPINHVRPVHRRCSYHGENDDLSTRSK